MDDKKLRMHGKHQPDGTNNSTQEKKEQQKGNKRDRSDSLFATLIPITLKYEGGLVNAPNDRGGKTNWGITHKFLKTYKNRAGISTEDVSDLTKEDAIKLYKAEWDNYGFGELDKTDIIKLVHDFSVNSGPTKAIKTLQEILNKRGFNLTVDGHIGAKTNKAVNSVDENWLKQELQRSRAEHCDRIVDKHPEQKVFIRGWFNRINDIGRKCGCNTIFQSRHLKY